MNICNRAEEQTTDTELCTVYYAPLNFRDIMLATGKLPPDALPGDLAGQVSKATLNVSLYLAKCEAHAFIGLYG